MLFDDPDSLAFALFLIVHGFPVVFLLTLIVTLTLFCEQFTVYLHFIISKCSFCGHVAYVLNMRTATVMDELARITPINPPIVNKNTNHNDHRQTAV
jgi:hypothetical protein